MRSTSGRLAATAVMTALGLTAVLTGCGNDSGGSGSGGGLADDSAQQISDKAEKALRGAESVHLKMDVADGAEGAGTAAGGAPASIDLVLDRDGNCAGEVGTDGQGSVEIVKRGEKVWMKPDAAFWKAQAPGKQGEAAAELFKGRYIYGTTSDAMLKPMAETCDLKRFQKEITSDDTKGEKLTKGKVTDVGGTEAIPIVNKEDGATQTVYVATEGEPYPLKLTSEGGDGDGTMTFSDYGDPVPDETPAKSESVDIAKLQKEMGQGAQTT